MDAFKEYLISNYPNVFISEDPFATILIWSNQSEMPKITGVSLVEQEGFVSSKGVNGQLLINLLRNAITPTPFLHIVYPRDMTYIYINDRKYTLDSGAKLIATTFRVQLGFDPAKTPNDPTQIRDAFHIWSRNAFDGIKVKKTDIDAIILNTQLTRFCSILEVKRSAKIKVGSWHPYAADLNNYLLCMSFSNILNVDYFTVHHEILEGNTINPDNYVDVFTYHYGSSPNPSKDSFDELYRSGKLLTVRNAIKELTGRCNQD